MEYQTTLVFALKEGPIGKANKTLEVYQFDNLKAAFLHHQLESIHLLKVYLYSQN